MFFLKKMILARNSHLIILEFAIPWNNDSYDENQNARGLLGFLKMLKDYPNPSTVL